MHTKHSERDGDPMRSHAEPDKAAVSSAAPAGLVIPFISNSRPTAAALLALEEASGPVEGFEPIGLLAVRLVAEWSLPRIQVVMAATGREEP